MNTESEYYGLINFQFCVLGDPVLKKINHKWEPDLAFSTDLYSYLKKHMVQVDTYVKASLDTWANIITII